MILISKWMFSSRAKHPPKTRPPICPYGHLLADAAHPPSHKYHHYVVAKLINHPPYSPKSIHETLCFRSMNWRHRVMSSKRSPLIRSLNLCGTPPSLLGILLDHNPFLFVLPVDYFVSSNHKPIYRKNSPKGTI